MSHSSDQDSPSPSDGLSTVILLDFVVFDGTGTIFWSYFPNSPIQLPKNIFVSATTPPTGVVHEVALTLTE